MRRVVHKLRPLTIMYCYLWWWWCCYCHFVTWDLFGVAQGAHVTIHARSEDDLDEDVVKGKVAKASGANYSIHKEKAQVIPEAGPVVSLN